MSEDSADVHQTIAAVFDQAGYDVSQRVGTELGSVDWFATRRIGFDRTKTYFVIMSACPADIAMTLTALEEKRLSYGADRAVAIVANEELLPNNEHDLGNQTTSILTVREFVIRLSDLEASVRATVDSYEKKNMSRDYFRRRGKTSDGKIVDAAEYIEQWVQSERSKTLVLAAESGGMLVADEASYRLGRRFLETPQKATSIINVSQLAVGMTAAIAFGYVVIVVNDGLNSFRDVGRLARYLVVARDVKEALRTLGVRGIDEVLELLPPTGEELEQWFLARIVPEQNKTRYRELWQKFEAFPALVQDVSDLSPLLEAIQTAEPFSHSDLAPEWIAHVVSNFVDNALDVTQRAKDSALNAQLALLEDTALEQFALGESGEFARRISLSSISHRWLRWSRWVERSRSDRTGEKYRFRSDLVCHYFLARKIIREMDSGSFDIVMRYQFPREYVLVFIGILSPSTLARLSDDRSAMARQQIEQEVERRVELTAAHALNRTVGALSTHVHRIRRRLDSETLKALEYEFQRIDAEIVYQKNLIDRTRRLDVLSEIVPEPVDVASVLELSVERLRETYPGIPIHVEVDAQIKVRATPALLREVVDCLLENACQAVTTTAERPRPEVRACGRALGDTVRIDVIDNGLGIPAEDRERIFQPYVTTKKGGEGKPLGTGMGLPIARRYASRVGGRVDLDPTHEQTCFFALFVRWKEFS